ncbi:MULTISPECIES: hypothetical protein [unclassified Sphingomonas]|uniref:hypothetical protein n=1 Tax=unclassified Sphingomonas TaxID=196159 RepID=UPI0025F3637F|nr:MULTISPECIES: hypothetical protein [unclassified Sphingomonas]
MSDERLVEFWAKTIAMRSPVMLQQLHGAALGLIAARRAMQRAMPPEFVHCPSLDMLLALFVADGHALPVAALVQATPAAPAVARRWTDVFVQRDLVAVRDGTATLTEAGFRMMADTCRAVIESQMAARVPSLN